MKIKKLLSGLTAMLMIVSMTVYLPISASAASNGSCGDSATYVLDDNGLLIISGTGEVKEGWGLYRSSVKKVIVNEGITSLAGCFSGANFLTEATLPQSLTTIQNATFSGCNKLLSVNIPKNVTVLNPLTFRNCTNKDLVIDIEGVLTSIGTRAIDSVTGTIKVHDQATLELVKAQAKSATVILVSGLDTEALDKTIEAAGKYTEANYTKESYTALTEAIKAGEEAKTKDEAAQSDINKAEKAIRDAVAGLVKADDKSNTPLKAKIDESNKLVDATESGYYLYSTSSRDALREAIKTAQGVYDKLTSTTEDLPEEADFLSALDTLTKAMTIDETGEAETGLKKLATLNEWTDFTNANNQFPKQNNDSYTEDSWAKYWDAYQKYQEARDKGRNYFSSKQLTDILDAVKAAMNELKALPPKTEAYEAAKQKALDILNAENSPYTKNSLESTREYVNGAISRIEDENGEIKEGVTQNDVDSATSSIESYISRLVEKGDVTELKALTEECKTLIESDYTVDTWTALAEKLATAQALVDDPDNAGKAAVEKATEELKAAKEALVIDYSEGEKTPGIVVVKKGGASAVIESGTADESMAGATKVRVTFDCASDVSFNSYASIEVTALVGEDNNFNKFAGNNNTTGAKGCSVTLDLANAIKAGDSYTISADTYAWNDAKDYVYAITQVEYLDAEGNVLKTFGGKVDTTKLDNYKKAIEDAKALVESGEYTEESVAVLQAAIEVAEAVLKDNDTPLPSAMEAPKSALDKAVEELVEIPKGNDVSGTVTTPGTDAEVTVTVATADGEAVAEVAAANGEYTIPELEDGEYVITFAAEGYVTRSYTATVTNGEIDIEAELHAVGDINGDGNITTVDVGLANAHAKATKTLEGYDFEVAEVSGDDIITTVDVGLINSTAKRV